MTKPFYQFSKPDQDGGTWVRDCNAKGVVWIGRIRQREPDGIWQHQTIEQFRENRETWHGHGQARYHAIGELQFLFDRKDEAV